MNATYCVSITPRPGDADAFCSNLANESARSLNRRIFTFWFNGVFGAILSAAGLACNSLILYLFTASARLRNRTVNAYILCLAAWDCGLILSGFFLCTVTSLMGTSRHSFVFSFLASYPLSNMCFIGCIWTTVGLTLDRYLAICHPLKHRVLSTPARVNVFLAILSVGAIAFSLPRAFEVQVCYCPDGPAAGPVPHLTQSYFLQYRVIAHLCLSSAGPFLVLLGLTVAMLIGLRRSLSVAGRFCSQRGGSAVMMATTKFARLVGPGPGSASSQRSVRLNSADNSTRSMLRPFRSKSSSNVALILVVVKFLLLYSLPTVLDVCENVLGSQFKRSFFVYLVDFSNMFAMLHSSTNLFIYLYFGSQARSLLRRTMSRRRDSATNSVFYNNNNVGSPSPSSSRFLAGSISRLTQARGSRSTPRGSTAIEVAEQFVPVKNGCRRGTTFN